MSGQASEETALYRIWGDADLLLYVGISDDFGRRWKEHAKKQPWWPEKRRMTVEWYDSRPEAEMAEETAIQAGRPKHNERHAAVPLQLCLGLNPQELTRTERVTAGAIARFRISYPDRARIAESGKCWSCGAEPGEFCRTATDRLAYYRQARFDRMTPPAMSGRTVPAEPDLIGMP